MVYAGITNAELAFLRIRYHLYRVKMFSGQVLAKRKQDDKWEVFCNEEDAINKVMQLCR